MQNVEPLLEEINISSSIWYIATIWPLYSLQFFLIRRTKVVNFYMGRTAICISCPEANINFLFSVPEYSHGF